MKLTIIEEDKREKDRYFNSISTPLTYRIDISLDYNDVDNIILKREYFYVGYNSGEQPDHFYYDNEGNYGEKLPIRRATFITRNFNSIYLKNKEKELIENFYQKLIESEQELQNQLEEKIKKYNKNIKLYKKYQSSELFIKIQRKQKLKKL